MKKTNRNTSLSSLLLSALLVAAMLICAVGCKDTNTTGGTTVTTTAPVESPITGSDSNTESDSTAETAAITETGESGVTSLGEGENKFTFTVVDGAGNETVYEISTNETVVGTALQSLGLIEGEAGQYGLYVKKVCGITADYDTTKTYWAFYVNGEYAMSGVDTTNITAGSTYSFKVEK